MDNEAPFQNYDPVLVAIDGSEDSRRILEHVAVLARIHDTSVVVFHVRQKAYAGAATLDVTPVPVLSADEAAAELTRLGIRAQAEEEDAYWGLTADAIVEAADRHSAKAIVIGTRGRGRATAVVLGSVAYKVLHLAKQPVLVIP